MKALHISKSNIKRHPSEKGIALITMLLLLLLLSALSVSMVVSNSSDTLINGYNRNARAAFYAADAGNTIVREDIRQRLNAKLNPTNLPVGTYPLLASDATDIVTAINSAYGSWVSVNSTGSSPESFKLYTANTSLTLYKCTVGYYTDSTLKTKGTPDTTADPATVTSSVTCPVHQYAYDWTYTYHYSLTTVGMVRNTGGTAITDSGNIIVTATSGNGISSFSQYGTFIDHMTKCSAELVGGTITGPQFTNGAWTFGQDQSYTFTGTVGSSGCPDTMNPKDTTISDTKPCGAMTQDANAGWMFSDGTCSSSPGPSVTHGKSTISPNFQKGFQPNQQYVSLPTDEQNQRSAVITGNGIKADGTSASDPTQSQLAASLKDSNGSSFTSTTSTGVFVAASSTGAINGGGIWVEGNADSITLSYSGSTTQIYTITQGASTTTVTITPGSTPGAGTTTVLTSTKSGSKTTTTTKTYTGVPTQSDPSGGSPTNGCVLYVDGNITSLSGTVQDNTGITVTTANDMTITNNLTYRTPVTDSSGNPKNSSMTQTLGLYTSGGSVYLQAPSSNANMEVDASILTTKLQSGACTYGNSCDGVLGVANGSNLGTLTIVGGRVQSRSMSFPSGVIDKRNVFFDTRYNGSFAPPFFPRPTAIINPPAENVTIQRTGWVLQTAY